MIEKELKQLITQRQFEQLLCEFRIDEVITQTNHYYSDDEGALKARQITVRVREIDGRYKLQVKMPISEEGALHIKKEYEEKLETLPALFSGDKISHITGECIADCKKNGFLTTERHICRWDDNTELCIDKSSYLGVTDYEIELEYQQEIDDRLLEKLGQSSINFDADCIGKYSRFITRVEGQT